MTVYTQQYDAANDRIYRIEVRKEYGRWRVICFPHKSGWFLVASEDRKKDARLYARGLAKAEVRRTGQPVEVVSRTLLGRFGKDKDTYGPDPRETRG